MLCSPFYVESVSHGTWRSSLYSDNVRFGPQGDIQRGNLHRRSATVPSLQHRIRILFGLWRPERDRCIGRRMNNFVLTGGRITSAAAGLCLGMSVVATRPD